MSNRKLYMLKVASARLRNLKLQERKYKGALVKRACMHLLVKYAATDADWANYRTYGEGPDDKTRDMDAYTNRKINWKDGFWGTVLGRMLRPFFESEANKEEYIRFLTQYATDDEMDRELANLGVDPSQWEEIKRRAKANRENRRAYTARAQAARDKEDLDLSNRTVADLERQLAEERKKRKEKGWDKEEDNKPSARRFYYDDGDRRFRSTYLTDTQAIFDPEYNRRMGIGTGANVTNNYYYGIGPDGKPIAVPAASTPAASTPAAATPAASTPAAIVDDPALPGLSTVLDLSSNPVLNPLSGPGVVGAVSGGTGHNPSAITLTDGPSSGRSGSVPITVDPFEASQIALPTTEPSKFDRAVDKGVDILHSVVNPFISDARKADIDSIASNMKDYVSSNPTLSQLADSGVDLIADTAGGKTSRTNPL